MTLNEFKAWLEGFETSFSCGTPNAEQWAAVKEKLAKVAATPTLGDRYPPIEPKSPTVKPFEPWGPVVTWSSGNRRHEQVVLLDVG